MTYSLRQGVEKFINAEFIEELSDNDYDNKAESKLKKILSQITVQCEEQKYNLIVKTIDNFFKSGEIQRNKLYLYCINFYDPTVKPKTTTQNGEEIQLNAYLQEDDLYKLYQFVKRHETDSTFGETVYQVMDSHNMTPPQVYKNAMLRRQDFSRVTDPKCKSVTKMLACQIIIGLHCNMEETDEVLFSAGYIRRKTKFDLTMQYFIEQKNYDIMAINEVLDELKLKVFSCYKSVKDNDNQ